MQVAALVNKKLDNRLRSTHHRDWHSISCASPNPFERSKAEVSQPLSAENALRREDRDCDRCGSRESHLVSVVKANAVKNKHADECLTDICRQRHSSCGSEHT